MLHISKRESWKENNDKNSKTKSMANDDNPFRQSTNATRLWYLLSSIILLDTANKVCKLPSIGWAIHHISSNCTAFLSIRVLNSDTEQQHPQGPPFLISPWNNKISQMRSTVYTYIKSHDIRISRCTYDAFDLIVANFRREGVTTCDALRNARLFK